jgi:hypothetical protein
MLFKRAQAAMEFLMTYGWAILVVLIVVGALAYFGVLNPQNLVPEKCVVSGGMFSCSDYIIQQGNISVTLVNAGGKDMIVYNVSYTADAPVLTEGCANFTSAGFPLSAGTSAAFTASSCKWGTGCQVVGCGKKKYAITVLYRTETINHTVTGELFASRSS